MTATKTPIETLPYEQAIQPCSDALLPWLGREIGRKTGWIFNGGVPYRTLRGKLLFNLRIDSSRYLNPVEESELFHGDGIDALVEWLATIGILEIAHFEVNLEDAALGERLRAR